MELLFLQVGRELRMRNHIQLILIIQGSFVLWSREQWISEYWTIAQVKIQG